MGLISALNLDGSVQVQSDGLLTLTTAEWDAARGGGSGGLVPSETFYNTTSGFIDDVAPTNLGTFSSQVGVALNATTMDLSCPNVPIGPHNASARVNGLGVGAGFITNQGFSAFVRNSDGNYSLTLAGSPPPDDNCIVNVTSNSGLFVVLATVTAGVVAVFTAAPTTGTLTDCNFYITVVDNA